MFATAAAAVNSLTSKKKIAVFVVSHHSGHINPIASMIPLYENAGYRVHFFCSVDRQKKIESMSLNVVFHTQAPSYQGGIQDAAETIIQKRFGLPLTDMVKGSFFPDLILPATVAILEDGFVDRIMALNPTVMVCDVSALWGILTSRLLQIPLITSCSCTLFEESGVEGAFGRQDQKKVHFFGAALSKTINKDIEKQMATMGASSDSVLSFIESAKNRQQKIVYCSLGTVVGQEQWSIGNRKDGNDMVTDFYKTVIETLGTNNRDDGTIRVILNIGKERRIEDLPIIPSNFMVTHFVPQMMVLSMVDTFITHCGNNGIHEAFFFGCPMLCVPVFGDQHPNASTIESMGVGVQIPSPFAPAPSPNLKHVTKEILGSKLNEILFQNHDTIQANCNRLKHQMRSQHFHYHNDGMREMEAFITAQQQQLKCSQQPVQMEELVVDVGSNLPSSRHHNSVKDTRTPAEEAADESESTADLTTASSADGAEPIHQTL